MIRRSIKQVAEWAAANRPPDYILLLKKHCETWNNQEDYYLITEENWNTLARLFSGQPAPLRKQPVRVPSRAGICKYATRDCCGKPYICSVDGGTCPDQFNDDCVKRNK